VHHRRLDTRQVVDWRIGMSTHVVVDGSNLATEGRALPSLKQLNEAVLAYMEEHPDDIITVVVDATFGHRIDPREVPEFDAAIENNELVAPPAGAIGRGDAFVLTIANKVNATIISNDSYQEFHGDYPWLFDEGRLVGGKPVPNVGWVFVTRVPVRGPVSRRAVKDANKSAKAKAGREPRKARASKEAAQPLPIPTAPPPGVKAKAPARAHRSGAAATAAAAAAASAAPGHDGESAPKPAAHADAPTATRQHLVNEFVPFLSFVEQHPVGSAVTGVVESYSSHGAYVSLGDARGYVPLRLMADPAPRSARTMMKLGEPVELVVVSFNPTRRSIDLSLPGMEPAEVKALVGKASQPKPARRPRKKAATADVAVITSEPPGPSPAPPKRTRKKAAAAASAAAAEPASQATKRQAAPAKRARKKATPATSVAVETPPAPSPTAPPVPVKRTRKKAVAADGAPVEAAPAPAPARPPAPRTRKKKAAAS
jgi:hypothetical protein